MIVPSFILLLHFIFLTWFFDCDIKRDFMYEKYSWPLSTVDQLFSYCLLTNHIKPRGLSCRSNVTKRGKRSGGSLAGHEEFGGLKTGKDSCSTTEWLFHRGQQEVPRGESDAVQFWFLRLLVMPEERAVLFSGAAARGYSRIL